MFQSQSQVFLYILLASLIACISLDRQQLTMKKGTKLTKSCIYIEITDNICYNRYILFLI